MGNAGAPRARVSAGGDGMGVGDCGWEYRQGNAGQRNGKLNYHGTLFAFVP